MKPRKQNILDGPVSLVFTRDANQAAAVHACGAPFLQGAPLLREYSKQFPLSSGGQLKFLFEAESGRVKTGELLLAYKADDGVEKLGEALAEIRALAAMSSEQLHAYKVSIKGKMPVSGKTRLRQLLAELDTLIPQAAVSYCRAALENRESFERWRKTTPAAGSTVSVTTVGKDGFASVERRKIK